MASKSFARNNLAKIPQNAYEPDTADDSDHLVSPKQKRKKKKIEKSRRKEAPAKSVHQKTKQQTIRLLKNKKQKRQKRNVGQEKITISTA